MVMRSWRQQRQHSRRSGRGATWRVRAAQPLVRGAGRGWHVHGVLGVLPRVRAREELQAASLPRGTHPATAAPSLARPLVSAAGGGVGGWLGAGGGYLDPDPLVPDFTCGLERCAGRSGSVPMAWGWLAESVMRCALGKKGCVQHNWE